MMILSLLKLEWLRLTGTKRLKASNKQMQKSIDELKKLPMSGEAEFDRLTDSFIQKADEVMRREEQKAEAFGNGEFERADMLHNVTLSLYEDLSKIQAEMAISLLPPDKQDEIRQAFYNKDIDEDTLTAMYNEAAGIKGEG